MLTTTRGEFALNLFTLSVDPADPTLAKGVMIGSDKYDNDGVVSFEFPKGRCSFLS